MDDKPRLRPIEAFPVQQDGKTLVYLKDPLNLATPIGISPVGYFILTHFDGRHSAVDIQEAYAKQFGAVLQSAELKSFVDMLDHHYYLESERFESYRNQIMLEFRRLPTRSPAHVGGVYKSDRAELIAQLDGYFTAAEGPGAPSATNKSSTPKRSSRRISTFIAAVLGMRGRISP